MSADLLPEHPDFLWRNPEPKSSYDAVIVGGGGHGLATALRPSVSEEQLAELRSRVTRLADRHPLYPDLTEVPR